jgi:cytochrome c-type biogenesis protein CcmH/NrfG
MSIVFNALKRGGPLRLDPKATPPMRSLSLPIRGSTIAALTAVLLLQAAAAAAQCKPMKSPPSAEYLDLVTRYAKGEHAAAVSALGADISDARRCDLDNLEAAAVGAKRCKGACEDRAVFERFSLKAAILLHAEREIQDRFPVPVSEQSFTCPIGPQAQVAERLVAMLLVVDPGAGSFLSRFYVGMARRAHRSYCLAEAEQWARTGLKRFPKDGKLLLTRAILLETIGVLTLVPAPRTPNQTPQTVREAEARTRKIKSHWEMTRTAFEAALAADPTLLEARLRLGRVLWRLNQPAPARAAFEEVLAKSKDATDLYLAHLFRGRVLEESERFEEAEQDYRAALSLRPPSEPAAVAVAHARLRLGNSAGAREALEAAMNQAPHRTELDPFKGYVMAHSREGQTLLDELKAELIR